jgi:uncharacterized membrane protein YozB (DUF420 family)
MAIVMGLTVLVGFGPTYYSRLVGHAPILFAVFTGAALRMRGNREAHKRLMLLAYVTIIGAAVARLPGVLPLGPLAFSGFTFVFILIGIIYDRLSRHRVHPVYIRGGGVLVLSVPLRLAVSGTDAWKSFAQILTRLVS